MSAQPSALQGLLQGLAAAPRHWRMLLLWWLAGLVPAAVAATPLAAMINDTFGHSPYAAAIDVGRDLPRLFDGFTEMFRGNAAAPFGLHLGLTVLGALLLSPWMVGMLVASLRAGRPLGFGELIQGGLQEYGRQFRLWLVLALPLGLLLLAASAGTNALRGVAAQATLESEHRRLMLAAGLVMLAALALAHACLEASRAQFAIDGLLRAARRAAARGVALLFERPFAVALIWLLTMGLATLIPPLAALAIIKWPVGLALLTTQLASLLMGALRAARLIALARIGAKAVAAPRTPLATPAREAATP